MNRDEFAYNGAAPAGRSDEEAGIRRALTILRVRVWLVVLGASLAAAVALAYVTARPPGYAAEAQLLVTPSTLEPPLQGLGLIPESPDPTRDVETAARLVTQPEVAHAVITSLRLTTTPEALLRRVKAVPVAESHLVAITAHDASARQATAIASQFAEQTVALRDRTLRRQIDALVPRLRAQQASETDSASRSTIAGWILSLQALRDRGDPTVGVQSLASAPLVRDGAGPVLTVAAALVAGLILGVGAAFLAEALDPRVRREEQLRQRFGLPVLAKIPGQRATGRPLPPAALSPATRDAFGRLRAVLDARQALWDSRGIIAVTGSTRREGRSTLALNLSATLAEAGMRVLLVETDFRHPSLAAALRVEPRLGVEDVLVDPAALRDAVIPFDQLGGSLELLLVSRPGAAGERLLAGGVDALLHEARAHADVVILDTAPPTIVGDALLLAERADHAIVAARLGATTLTGIERLEELLGQTRARPLGFVVLAARGRAPAKAASRSTAAQRDGLPAGSVLHRDAVE